MKPCKHMEGWVTDKQWRKRIFKDSAAVRRYAMQVMPADLKRLGFGVGIWESDDYFRFTYGHK